MLCAHCTRDYYLWTPDIITTTYRQVYRCALTGGTYTAASVGCIETKAAVRPSCTRCHCTTSWSAVWHLNGEFDIMVLWVKSCLEVRRVIFSWPVVNELLAINNLDSFQQNQIRWNWRQTHRDCMHSMFGKHRHFHESASYLLQCCW